MGKAKRSRIAEMRKKTEELRSMRYAKKDTSPKIPCPFDQTRLHPRFPKDKNKLVHFYCEHCGKKFICSDEEAEILKINKRTYYNLSYYIEDKEKLDVARKQLKPKPSVPLDQDSVLIYGNSFDCIIPGHKTERLRISVPARVKKGIKRLIMPYAVYCPECKSYYILDHTYKMYEYARIACHVYSKQEARRLRKEKSANGSDARSVLMERGYSVSKAANLPASERHRILREVIETRVLSPEEIENYLRTFIRQHETVSQNREAVQKWQEDLEYVILYSRETQCPVLDS